MKPCVIYLTKKLAPSQNVATARIAPKNLLGPAPDNVLIVLQISSKSIHFRRNSSRTREDCFLSKAYKNQANSDTVDVYPPQIYGNYTTVKYAVKLAIS